MSGCTDKRFEKMLYAWELGILDDDRRRELELHLLECESCNRAAREMERPVALIREDPEVREELEKLAIIEAAEDSPVDEDIAGESGPRSRKRWFSYAAVAAVVFLILVFRPWEPDRQIDPDLVASENKLVIAPFEALGWPDEASEMGTMAANLLITDLSESRFVRVVSARRRADLMAQLQITPEQRDGWLKLARESRSRWLVEGSIMRERSRLVLGSRLVDVSDGTVVASQEITADTGQTIFGLIDRLTVQIKRDLALPLEALDEPDPRVADVTTHSPLAYRYYLEGLEHYSKFDYPPAAAAFETAVELDSTFAMAYYQLSMLVNRAYMEQALAHAGGASQRERVFIDARAAGLERDFERAYTILMDASARFPDEKEIYFRAGTYARILGRPHEAIESYRAVIDLDPEHKLAYNQLAYLYDQVGKFDSAMWALDRYVEIAPDEPNPNDSRGQICAMNGELDMAIEAYRKALEIRPDFSASLMYLGYMYTYRGDYDSASVYLRRFASLSNTRQRSAGRLYLAYIPLYQRRLPQAIEVLNQGIAADTMEHYTADRDFKHLLKAFIYTELGRHREALDQLRTAREIATAASIKRYMVHEIAINALCGNDTGAQSLADTLRRFIDSTGGSTVDLFYVEGVIAFNQGDLATAEERLRTAADSSREFHVRYWLAQTLIEQGRFDEATEILEAALSRYDSPRIFVALWSVRAEYLLAYAYERAGQIETAIDRYEHFIDIWKNADPESELVAEARQRVKQLRSRP